MTSVTETRRLREGDQPLPIPNEGRDIGLLVAQDVLERRRLGISRYGTPLQAFNGRDALRDLYEELLDAAAYVRQLIEEARTCRCCRGSISDDSTCGDCGCSNHIQGDASAGEA